MVTYTDAWSGAHGPLLRAHFHSGYNGGSHLIPKVEKNPWLNSAVASADNSEEELGEAVIEEPRIGPISELEED